MKEGTGNGPAASAQPAEPKQQAHRLAILFADIAPSKTSNRSGRSMEKDATREDRGLVLESVAEGRGHILRTGEDLVIARFANATEALRAAIAIQRSATEETDRKAPPRIRLFLHSCEASVTEEDLETALSAAIAKLANLTKPGHIYASSEAYNNTQALKAVEFKPLGANENASADQAERFR